MSKDYSKLKVCFLFILLALLMRFFSFFPSVINHDESTYIMIADGLRDGQIYLVDVVDTKPIGIFLLFGLFQEVFGEAVYLIRILTSVVIAFTAFFLFLAHRQLSNEKHAPLASGIIYICISSIFTFYGVSPNTEHFFCLFTAMALYLLLRNKQLWEFFLAGLCLGLGFIIKYVVLFDAIAFALFLAWWTRNTPNFLTSLIKKYLSIGLGFSLPFLAVVLYYNQLSQLAIFWEFTFGVSQRYFVDAQWYDYFTYLGDALGRFFPVVFFFLYGLLDRRFTPIALKYLVGLWSILVLIIILLPGKFFGHYFIQFMLPLSLLAGSFFARKRQLEKHWKWLRSPRIGIPLLVLIFFANTFFQKLDYFDKPDYPKEIAAAIQENLSEEDLIYVATNQHIVYHLLNKKSPTPYLHSSLLWSAENRNALQIRLDQELSKIFIQEPKYLVLNPYQAKDAMMHPFLDKVYRVKKQFNNGVYLFERI